MGSSSMVAVVIVGVMLNLDHKGSAFADDANGRLSQNFTPYHYNLEMTPDIYGDSPSLAVNGSVQIYFTCEVASKIVMVNSIGLKIDNSSVKISLVPGQSGDLSAPILSKWKKDDWFEFLSVETTQPLIRNVSYILEMNFADKLGFHPAGFFSDRYNSSSGIIKYIAATHFEPNRGRWAFPGFDEPDFKATFNITIVRKTPAISAANTQLLYTIDRGNGWLADVYATTPKMSLYLVAFSVGELQKLSAGRDNGYEVNILARSQIVPQMNFSLSTAARILAWFENDTGIKYRGAKSDYLVLPSEEGAMENWGLVRIGEQRIAYNPETSPASQKQGVMHIQSHEIAHYWYGNLVTCKWWDDTWLKEGFATYYDYRPAQILGWEGSEASQVSTQNFLEIDQRNSSDPVRKSVPTVWDARSAFQGSTYPKGGAMVHMLEAILTTPTFKAAMTKFLLKHQYKTVTTDDLWQTLTEQAAIDGIKNPDGSPLDVKLRMDPWLNQMGFPLVSVTRKADGTATLMRTRFLRPPRQIAGIPSPYNYNWDVPITIVSAESGPEAWDAAPSTWIDIKVSHKTVSGFPTDLNKWAVINAKFAMYYRVKYDRKSQTAIVSQLTRDHTAIHVESRSQIIDDAFSVARAGHFPETKAMETTLYLVNETKWGPWNAALKHLKYSDLLSRKQSWNGLLRTYILGLTVPVYDRLGWTYDDKETPFEQFLRRDMISMSCACGHADCLTKARAQYALVVANPSANVVDPNNLPTVLCIGVREGTEADWQLAFDQYLARKKSQIKEERRAYLYACTCTTNTNLLDRLLAVLDTHIRDPDQVVLCQYLSQSDYGAQILWNYLDINWNNSTFGYYGTSFLEYIGLRFTTKKELDNLLAFKARHPSRWPAEAAAYTNLILDIESNINWLSTSSRLQCWLQNHQRLPLSGTMRVKRANGDGSGATIC